MICSVEGCDRTGDPAADGSYRCERHPWVPYHSRTLALLTGRPLPGTREHVQEWAAIVAGDTLGKGPTDANLEHLEVAMRSFKIARAEANRKAHTDHTGDEPMNITEAHELLTAYSRDFPNTVDPELENRLHEARRVAGLSPLPAAGDDLTNGDYWTSGMSDAAIAKAATTTQETNR